MAAPRHGRLRLGRPLVVLVAERPHRGIMRVIVVKLIAGGSGSGVLR
jgi:hypothetical protein